LESELSKKTIKDSRKELLKNSVLQKDKKVKIEDLK
jgi:hypothetical protein